MEIRKYRKTDNIDEVSRVYARCWKTAYQGIVPQDYLDAIPENRWSPILINEVSNLLLAVDGDTVIGSATYCAARDGASEGWGEIVSLYLLPEYWRRGIGTCLFQEAVKALHELGYEKLCLWVLEENQPARKFYETNGFCCSGDIISADIGGKTLNEVRYVHPPEKPACR